MLFSSSLVNQAPPPEHFPQVFPQVSCVPSLQPPPLFLKCKQKELDVFVYGSLPLDRDINQQMFYNSLVARKQKVLGILGH